MSIVSYFLLVMLIFKSSFFAALTCASPVLHPDEVKALREIFKTLGVKILNPNEDPCVSRILKITDDVLKPGQNSTVECDCSFDDNKTCHIKSLSIKSFSLSGRLPPDLIKFRYLESIDLCRNYFSGTIPMEWASMPYLKSISLCANNLSGNLPPGLGNFTNLTFIGLEANQFSGTIPDELGNLTNLEGLQIGSNQFIGRLPNTFARLVKLKEFMVGDNNFSGSIPEYIGKWTRLQKLYLFASGLKGPIPDSVSTLENLTDVRISDTTGIDSFPNISSNNINYLILRNLNMSGTIPSSIWQKPNLKTLDVSFNKLTGEVSGVTDPPEYTYLTGNMLSGKVDSGSFTTSLSDNIDLSYNNFTWSSSCEERSNINTYRSSYLRGNLSGLLPCAGQKKCQNYERSIHINCGGGNETIENASGQVMYQGDMSAPTRAATNHHWTNWGFSNTGDFMDRGISEDMFIIEANHSRSVDSSELYKTARRSALSLVYYAFCLENGTYRVKLHFMEIQFTDEEPYSRLGRRIFDVYVQGVLVWKDFNIREEAKGAYRPVVKEVNVTVTDHTLEIRLYWAGKGTTLIPKRGNYGPLISAISFCHSSEHQCGVRKDKHMSSYPIILGATGAFICIIFLALGIYSRRRCIGEKNTIERDLRAQGLQTVCFTWRQLQVATKNFDQANKLGEGGFGSVFKGELLDGTIIAVKQLSSKSCQGNREFVNEIGMISGLHHPNLVKLYGCCVEKNHLLLVYEYMENNSLAHALFGKSCLKLDWAARQKICVGLAQGLEFLHEGSMIRMVHRDIKSTNVLLDGDLNAKISDFGLARLHEEEQSHISTRIAGTIGYMAPEYALWGHLTEKADVYSFGVVALEIVSGKSIMKHKGATDDASLIDWGFMLQQKGSLLEIVDPKLEGDFSHKEAERMIKVALLCSNSSPSSRPTMPEAVKMLEGEIEITQSISDTPVYGDLRFSKLRTSLGTSTSASGTKTSWSAQATTTVASSVSGYDLYPFNPESVILDTTGETSSPPSM